MSRGPRGGPASTPRVALVGADGAGKSTITDDARDRTAAGSGQAIYMGVNLEASSLMLPTTRLLLAAKRARGGRPDLVARLPRAWTTATADAAGGPHRRGHRPDGRVDARGVAPPVRRLRLHPGGYIVVFDRHFFADYYHTDIAPASRGAGPVRALHGWMLQNAYPKPDLVICLDAPGERAVRPQAGGESRVAGAAPAAVLRLAGRSGVRGRRRRPPLDEVFAEVVDAIAATGGRSRVKILLASPIDPGTTATLRRDTTC